MLSNSQQTKLSRERESFVLFCFSTLQNVNVAQNIYYIHFFHEPQDSEFLFALQTFQSNAPKLIFEKTKCSTDLNLLSIQQMSHSLLMFSAASLVCLGYLLLMAIVLHLQLVQRNRCQPGEDQKCPLSFLCVLQKAI